MFIDDQILRMLLASSYSQTLKRNILNRFSSGEAITIGQGNQTEVTFSDLQELMAMLDHCEATA